MNQVVSIITCTYNRPDLLRGCLASVAAQTRTDWEHLITDPDSPNLRIRAILQIARDDDSRIRTFHRSPNVDQPARYWNEMIDLARGDYVCFLDDDCCQRPDFLARMAGHLDAHPEVDAVTCGFALHHDDGRVEDVHLNLETPSLVDRRNTIDTSSFLIRRAALDRVGYFPLDIRTNEDWAMARRMKKCLRVDHLADVLVDNLAHPAQRLTRTLALGNVRDKERVRWSTWEAEIGVNIVGREGTLSFLETSAQIPWIKAGPDAMIIVSPADLPIEIVEGTAKRAQRFVIAFCHWHQPIFDLAAVTRMRSHRETWVVTKTPTDWPLFQEIVGEHVIACADPARNLGRIVNAARSPRFEAVIP